MNRNWLCSAAIVTASACLTVSTAIPSVATPPGVQAAPRSAITSKPLVSSKSITVSKQSYTRLYTKEGCSAYEIVAKPALIKGGTKAARTTFNSKINDIVQKEVDAVLATIFEYAIEDAKNGRPCVPASSTNNAATVKVSASIYRNRYVSVALDVWYSYDRASGSCNDYYRTPTFDTKKRTWKKLSDFASSNHNQLALTWLSAIGELAEPYNFGNVVAPKLPKGYAVGKEAWTVGSKGVTFWSAAGDHGRSCAAGPRHRTIPWRDILKPGDSAGTKRSYKKVPVRWDLDSPIDGRATVSVKGRAITVTWCSGKPCTTYYGTRNGRKWTNAWGTYKAGDEVHGTPVVVRFNSTKNSAKPTAVTYAIYD